MTGTALGAIVGLILWCSTHRRLGLEAGPVAVSVFFLFLSLGALVGLWLDIKYVLDVPRAVATWPHFY